MNTELHQAVTPNADFQFVSIGRWQTAEDFHTATQSPGFRESAAQRDPSAMSISTRSWFSRSNQRASRLCHGSVACRASAETRKVAELAVHHIPCDSCSDLTREVLHR
jgi:hypothetical protein